MIADGSARWAVRVLLVAALGAILGCDRAAAPFRAAMPALRGDSTVPTAVIYVEDWGLGARHPGPQVVVAVWQDGRIIWSRDLLRGGPPYLVAKVAPQKLQTALNTLDAQSVFTDPARNDAHFGPDSTFTVIAFTGKRRMTMASWHELAEASPRIVATTSGLELLGGRDRAAVLAAQPPRYRRFRWNWSVVRKSLLALIPAKGQASRNLRFEFRFPSRAPKSEPATRP